MTPVKRHYDATGRRAQAEQRFDAVVTATKERFLTHGFAATKVVDVANASDVSVEYVYKRFGNKAGLVRAVVARALEGNGSEPAEIRSDALQATDARTLIQGWARLSTEVAPLVAPLLLLVKAAAVQDANVAALATELEASRHERMVHNARRLVGTGQVRQGVDVEQVGDVLWAFSSPELYDLLVIGRDWGIDRYGEFVARGIAGALLGP